ncbi:meiosis-specific protein MEI4 isoform X1 [Nematostella vectensis]|uniref:meiosis-specific protein MEI4 isoform X1 n=1 Tax=Nematostella vectensis TaxID=45351 RepID=UPI00207766C6|nr:meiosis-specific protein MEI4 isoform X1 [Nematostella vectensis]XP_032240874.2 meiosis-specific protein MEI4 isoform X1 [Nematostella vectensis]
MQWGWRGTPGFDDPWPFANARNFKIRNLLSMDGSLDVEFLNCFKLALSLAIIRTKPQNISAKSYTEELSEKLKKKLDSHRDQVVELKQQLLKSRQELLVLKHKEARDNTLKENTFQDISTQRDEIDILTPPPSSEEKDQDGGTIMELQKHVEFMKSVTFLMNHSKAEENREEQVVPETVSRAISIITMESRKCLIDLPSKVVLSCIRAINELLDVESTEKSSRMRDSVLLLVRDLSQQVIECKSEMASMQSELSHYIVLLGYGSASRDGILVELASCLLGVSSKLRDVSQGRCSIRAVLHEYNNSVHIFSAIERILQKTLPQQECPATVQARLMEMLDDSVMHISHCFPLFARYAWKVQGLLCHLSVT